MTSRKVNQVALCIKVLDICFVKFDNLFRKLILAYPLVLFTPGGSVTEWLGRRT